MRYANDWFRLEIDRVARRVTIVRSARPFESALDAENACRPVIDALAPIDRARHRLLMDARDAIGRNDPEYEGWFAPLRREIVEGFARVAVVVRTASGKLQAVRLTSADRHESVRVFTRVEDAQAWLDAP